MVAISHNRTVAPDLVAKLIAATGSEFIHPPEFGVFPKAGRAVIVHVDNVLIPAIEFAYMF